MITTVEELTILLLRGVGMGGDFEKKNVYPASELDRKNILQLRKTDLKLENSCSNTAVKSKKYRAQARSPTSSPPSSSSSPLPPPSPLPPLFFSNWFLSISGYLWCQNHAKLDGFSKPVETKS